MVVDKGVTKPCRSLKSPHIELSMPADCILGPGEKATFDLGVTFKFPKGVCGIVALQPRLLKKQILRVQTNVLCKCFFIS